MEYRFPTAIEKGSGIPSLFEPFHDSEAEQGKSMFSSLSLPSTFIP